MKQSSNKKANASSPQFKVANKKSDFVLLAITFVVLEISNLIIMLGVEKYFIAGIVFAVLTFCIIGAIMLSMYTFVLRVNGTEISGRTALGKRFRFNKSEIINTRYQHYRATYRSCARTILTIKTADLEIGIESTMVGYQELVPFIFRGKFKDKEKEELSKYTEWIWVLYENLIEKNLATVMGIEDNSGKEVIAAIAIEEAKLTVSQKNVETAEIVAEIAEIDVKLVEQNLQELLEEYKKQYDKTGTIPEFAY